MLCRYTKCSHESYGRGSPTLRREVMESRLGKPRTEACIFFIRTTLKLQDCYIALQSVYRVFGAFPACYDDDVIFFTPSVKVKLCLLSLYSNVRLVYGQLRGPTGFLLRLRSTSQQGQMVFNDVLFGVWYAQIFTQICNPPTNSRLCELRIDYLIEDG